MIRKIAFVFTILFIFSVPWEENLSLGSLGSFNRLMGLAASAVWIFSIFTSHHLRKLHPFHFAVVLFILWNLTSVFWTVQFEQTRERITTYVQLAILSYMLWDQVVNALQLRVILQAYVLGCFVSIIGTISNFISGVEAFEYSGGRYVATGFNANDLAIILAMGLPIAWYLLQNPQFERRWKNLTIVNLIFIPASIFAILLTGSRAGFLTTLIAMLYILLSYGKIGWMKKAAALCALLIAFLVIQPLIPEATIQRLSTTLSSIETGDLGGRGNIYQDATRIINASPLLGIGSGAFSQASTWKTLAHNTEISVLSETGAIGLLLFIAIFAIAGVEAVRMPRVQSRFWLTMLLLWALGSSSVSWEFRKPTWFLLSMLVITAEVMRQQVKDQETAAFETAQSAWSELGN